MRTARVSPSRCSSSFENYVFTSLAVGMSTPFGAAVQHQNGRFESTDRLTEALCCRAVVLARPVGAAPRTREGLAARPLLRLSVLQMTQRWHRRHNHPRVVRRWLLRGRQLVAPVVAGHRRLVPRCRHNLVDCIGRERPALGPAQRVRELTEVRVADKRRRDAVVRDNEAQG